MPRPHRWNKINRKAPNIKRINERDDPFAHGRRRVVFLIAEHAKGDGETELQEDEGEFYPEGDAQDAVLAVVDSETLVLPTDEDCGDDVAGSGWELACF
jgi:hypothetical protein